MGEWLCELKLLSVVGAVVAIVLLTALNAGDARRQVTAFPANSLEQVAESAGETQGWDEGWGLVNVDLDEAE
jgi:hypothetical protein